jgi:hypothetical protein
MLRKMFDLRRELKLHTSMSFRATTLRRRVLLVILLGLIAGPQAFGQAKTSPIAFANQDAVVATFVSPPNMGDSSGNTSSDSDQWLKVEFHYGATALAVNPYIDAVQFKVWIEGLDSVAVNPAQPSGKGVAIALTGSINYVNIPAGKDIYGVFYVPPATLGRYSSEHGPTDFERKFDVHIEAYIGGALMDAIDKNHEDDPNWFKQLRVVPNMVYRQDQCPFIVTDASRYPPIKLPADVSQ